MISGGRRAGGLPQRWAIGASPEGAARLRRLCARHPGPPPGTGATARSRFDPWIEDSEFPGITRIYEGLHDVSL